VSEEVEAEVHEEVTAEVVGMAEVVVTVAIEEAEAVAEEVTAEATEVAEVVVAVHEEDSAEVHEEDSAEVHEVVTEVDHLEIEAGNSLVTRTKTLFPVKIRLTQVA